MITFDNSLPQMIDLVADIRGAEAVANNLFLRDAIGRLTFVVLDESMNSLERQDLSQLMNIHLESYVDESGISVATPDELFDDSLRDQNVGMLIEIDQPSYKGNIRLLDRRVVGADWLRKPENTTTTIPRLFFVSLKGGVGRSTALCVLAAHLAAGGRRVLAIDLDLEAPGLGTMLLNSSNIPQYGLLDYLVETNLRPVEDDFVTEMLGYSTLSGGRGSITVLPAFGSSSNEHPMNVLGKIARAYLPSDSDPSLTGLTAKIEMLITRLTDSGDYDVVLVDARAGLHESTAAAAVALQGNTLVFGMDQPQTYAGYKALLAQLALTLGEEWRSRIHIVEAKVGSSGPSQDFIDGMIDILPDLRAQENISNDRLEDFSSTFNVEWDSNLPIEVVDSITKPDIDSTYIFESDNFSRFDPLKQPDRLNKVIYNAVYGEFIKNCEEIIAAAEQVEGVA